VLRVDPHHGVCQGDRTLESRDRLDMRMTAGSLAVAYLTADSVGLTAERLSGCNVKVSESGDVFDIDPKNFSSESAILLVYQSDYPVLLFRLPELIDILFSRDCKSTESLR
jgi:hypothetical protein